MKSKNKSEKAYMKSVGKSVKSGQNGRTPLEKVTGVTPAVGSGVDPITNTSYPKRKKESRRGK